MSEQTPDEALLPERQDHGADRTSPYPVSRLAPPFEPLDLTDEIAAAEATLDTRVAAQLELIAEQIRSLQAQARAIIDQAREDQRLHRARCTFRRLPGKVYHLYKRADGALEFSMLSPADWGNRPPHTFLGSYQLGADMRWTPTSSG